MVVKGAVVTESGVTFAVILVHQFVLESQEESELTAEMLRAYFPGMPIVLGSELQGGGLKYRCGRPDLARFLASISSDQIPWVTYTIRS